jgi:hypothetical protein
MPDTRDPHPAVAVVLALVYPGMGHVYLRRWGRALLWFTLTFLTITLTVPATAFEDVETAAGVVSAFQSLPLSTYAALLGVTVGSVGDAYVLASHRSTTDGHHCPSCGKELDEDLDFCHWCTQRLDGNAAPTQ